MNDNEFVTYKILNQTANSYNKSVLAMNAGYDGDAVTTLPWNIPNGLNQMLGMVWPELANQNNVTYEWKTSGKGTMGTMENLARNYLSNGKVVLAAYATKGPLYGHVDTVMMARVNTYDVWYGTVSDTYKKGSRWKAHRL